jgi:uncharacterized protein (DUF427 family)
MEKCVPDIEVFRGAGDVRVFQRGKAYGDRGDGLTFEPTDRWVRAKIGDGFVVDSKRALLLWESGTPVSTYVFPADDVRTDLLRTAPPPTERGRLLASEWWDLELGNRRYERLAWGYDDGPLAGYVGLDWFGRKEPGVEHWYEEEEEVWVHPRDPHKRVDAIPSSRHVEVLIGGRMLADTRSPVILYETWLPDRYYIPAHDVDLNQLEETDLRTRCPYKGIADYRSVKDAPEGKNIVWSYRDPIPAAHQIKDHIAFYNEVVDISVDGVEQAQPVTHFKARLANDAPDTTGV